MLPMTLAAALELVLNHYDIYDIDDLVAILRSPDDASQVADLIDGSRALIDLRCDGGYSTRQCADRVRDGDGWHDHGKRDQRA